MKSPFSGYITTRANLSSSKVMFLFWSLHIPVGHCVMISFQELVPLTSGVYIYHHYTTYDHSLGHCTDHYDRVWDRHDPESDHAQVFNVSEIIIEVYKNVCLNTNCFRFYFTFLPRNGTLQKLSNGLWNCSVEDYSHIHHHLACNLKTECDDGRDETERCPFSSPECQGLVAVCDQCYSLDMSQRVANNQQGNEHCESLGGALGFPKCLNDWYGTLRNMTRIHPERVRGLLVGLSINDNSLPAVYRYVITADSTTHYHSVQCSCSVQVGGKKCLAPDIINAKDQMHFITTHDFTKAILKPHLCTVGYPQQTFGVVCEFRGNSSKTRHHSRQTPLPSTQFVLSTGPQVFTVCDGGHVTYTFFLCGSKQYKVCGQQQSTSVYDQLFCTVQSRDHGVIPTPSFACHDGVTVSFTLVCDFIGDCQDESDESSCQHPVCVNTFACATEQCLYFDQVCDQTPHCPDKSDEQKCDSVQNVLTNTLYFPSPALTTFDDVRQFVSIPMEPNESCPESHYRCPGEFSDCLPVFTRCNGVYDCLDHQDEDGCEEMACPGLFRCRVSTSCVHRDHLCDGWPHCPMQDDELLCGVTCPVTCLCQGHTFLCQQPFSAFRFSQVRFLDATRTGMTLSDMDNNTYLIHLVLRQCNLTTLPDIKLLNVRLLDLGDNKLQQVNMTSFIGLENLRVLSLSNNPLNSLCSSGFQQSVLSEVDLSFTSLTIFDAQVFSSFPSVQKLNLTFTSVHEINGEGFQLMTQLTELYMEGSPVEMFPSNLYKDLSYLRIISAENYKLCCNQILPLNFDNIVCHAPKDEISSCEDLLQSWTYRAFLWLTTTLSLTGNAFCFCARFLARRMASSSAFSVFVINLTIADFLMGVYNTIIGAADERYRGIYLYYDDTWKNSVTCKVAGSLSLLSSEVSALIIWLITMDRFVVLRFPFSTWRFERASAMVACLLTWLVGWCLALLPLLPVIAHWAFYSQTGICIPLPVTRRQFKGKLYSFVVFIVFNLILFVMISGGQLFIYWSIQKNALKSSSTKMSKDMTIARRLITVAVTDFMCWFPIGLCGILAHVDVPVPGEISIALAVFVLPLNSAVNPFLYTFNTLSEKRRRSKEAEFLKWLESHTDLVVN